MCVCMSGNKVTGTKLHISPTIINCKSFFCTVTIILFLFKTLMLQFSIRKFDGANKHAI